MTKVTNLDWEGYFDSFSKLSGPQKKRYLENQVDRYKEAMTEAAVCKETLYALLEFIGNKSEKKRLWTDKMKNTLEELTIVTGQVASNRGQKTGDKNQ